jgi:hypothetical protein
MRQFTATYASGIAAYASTDILYGMKHKLQIPLYIKQ